MSTEFTPEFLYRQIIDHIIEQIWEEKLLPGERMPSENEYARQNSISRITVHRAYKELEAAGILVGRKGSGTYVTPDALSHMSKKDARMKIAVVFPESPTYPFFKDIKRAIRDEMKKVSVEADFLVNLTPEEERRSLDIILKNNYDGILFSPYRVDGMFNEHVVDLLENSSIPIVMLGKPPVNFFCDAVYYDDFNATFESVKECYYHQFNEVVFLTVPALSEPFTLNERVAGYNMGMRRFFPGIKPCVLDIQANNFEKLFMEKINFCRGKLAVLLYDDILFSNVNELLKKNNIRLCRKVFVLGYNNFEDICNSYPIKLSSVEIPKYGAGKKAFHLLYGKMFRKTENECMHILIKPNIIHRESF